MTAQILQFPRKPRLVTDRIFDDLDSFGRLYRDTLPSECDPTDPAYSMLRKPHRMREDPPIVTTGVLETRGKEPA